MSGAGHSTTRAVANAAGNLVECVVDSTVFTYDGEDASAIVTQTQAELDTNILATGRASVVLPPTAARPTPGKPFPKVPPGKP